MYKRKFVGYAEMNYLIPLVGILLEKFFAVLRVSGGGFRQFACFIDKGVDIVGSYVFTVDILGTKDKSEEQIVHTRKRVHVAMAVIMGTVIFIFNILNNTSVIDAVYVLASYTYGPILGLFAFGIITKRKVNDRYIPLVAVVSPIICYVIQSNSEAWFNGYQMSYELLILNAAITFIGTFVFSSGKKQMKQM